MAGKSKIEWCTDTWNPIVGCSIVSPGCTNCYAMKMAGRLERMGALGCDHYFGTTEPSKAGPVWTGKVAFAPDHLLTQPLAWKSPRRIFVNSMGDLFHESVPDAWIDRVFAVMALAPWHTFQVLTKRSARMRAWTNDPETPFRVADAKNVLGAGSFVWPLANVWLGVSTEDQRRADERIPDLLATPAAVRFVSAEPLLGPIDLTWIAEPDEERDGVIDALLGCNWIDGQGYGEKYFPIRPGHQGLTMTRRVCSSDADILANKKLDWIIAGGESGPYARPMRFEWARAIRDQCAAAAVPFFFKQIGDAVWAPDIKSMPGGIGPGFGAYDHCKFDMNTDTVRVGKKRAGRLLDGREHNEMPETRT